MTTSTGGPALQVLVYLENDEHVALALEMDLRGYGDTVESAVSELVELVTTQISFARFKGQPGMIWRDAEAPYWVQYQDGRRRALGQAVSAQPVAGGLAQDLPTINMPLPSPYAIAQKLSQFHSADA